MSALPATQLDSLDRPVSQAQILLVGNDADLLSYREKVLRSAGWAATSKAPAEVTGKTCKTSDICLVCHTLSAQQRAALVRTLREDCPDTRILAITTGDIGRAEADRFDALIDNLEGPAALIRKVRQQLGIGSL